MQASHLGLGSVFAPHVSQLPGEGVKETKLVDVAGPLDDLSVDGREEEMDNELPQLEATPP